MIKAAFIIEATINLIAGIWWIVNPKSQLKLTFPQKFIDNNPAFLLISQFWSAMILMETVLLLYGIFDISSRMMIYVTLLSGEFFMIPPTIHFMIKEKATEKIGMLLLMFSLFALVRMLLMYAISMGAT